jgi:ABC-type polar amino acid transport system ATPase subunit
LNRRHVNLRRKPMVEFQNVSKRYGDHLVLDDVSATVYEGEVVVICGPSGSGKSTLLRAVNGLETIDDGLIFVEGKAVGKRFENGRWVPDTEAELCKMRQQIGMVFQQFNLFPHMTALENVMEGLISVKKMKDKEALAVARDTLAMMSLSDKADSRPSKLSGGQQQRVAIARALAMRPKVMLFDEPTSALDPELVGEVLNVMLGIAREGFTMIVVTHEMEFARQVADRIFFIDEGQILIEGTPDKFFSDPGHIRAREFLGKLLRLTDTPDLPDLPDLP